MFKECDITKNGFTGSYNLLKYIIQKYTNELPYNGYVTRAIKCFGYRREHHFDRMGVPLKIWIIINKDLFIAALTGRIKIEDYKTLHELKEEFKELKNNN